MSMIRAATVAVAFTCLALPPQAVRQAAGGLEQAKRDLASGNPDTALATLGSLEAAQPDNATRVEIHLLAAQAYNLKSMPSEARARLQKVIEIQPDSVRGHFGLVQHYHNLRDFEAAERHARKIVAAAPQSYDDQLIRGLFLTGRNPVNWE